MELAAAAAETAAKQSRVEPQLQVVIKKPPLPPLPIPKFAGDPMEFSNFITIFDATVHTNDTLTASQKLAYLQSYVEGEAKRLISKILVTDENYKLARETLSTNFGHSSQTISVLYDKLHSVARARNDPFSIRDTYNEVESILQMLEHAGVEVNTDQYLRYEVFKKWPFPLIKQLVRSTAATLQDFRRDLKAEVELQIQLTQAAGYTQPQQHQRPKPYGDRPAKQRSSGSYTSAPTSGVAQRKASAATQHQGAAPCRALPPPSDRYRRKRHTAPFAASSTMQSNARDTKRLFSERRNLARKGAKSASETCTKDHLASAT